MIKIKKLKLLRVVLTLTISSSILSTHAVTLKTIPPSKNLSKVNINKIKNSLKFAPQQLLVQFKKNQSITTLLSVNKLLSLSSRSINNLKTGENIAVIKITKDIDLKSAFKQFKSDPGVKAVSYNYLRQLYFSPNDPSYSGTVNEMWGLHDTAPDLTSIVGPSPWPNISDKVIGNDIDAEKAWDVWNKVSASDKANVIVAVIDSGVDYNHPDLIDAMWDGSNATINKLLSPTLNHGIDVAENDDDPYPTLVNHGTHVSGTIAATANNGIGIPGVASGVKIMAIKVGTDLLGFVADSALIPGIEYAVENGADIINISLGGKSPENTILTDVIKNAVDKGVFFVFAAGNDSNDNDVTEIRYNSAGGEVKINDWPSYYANVESTKVGVISVAATDQAGLIARFSNYGNKSVNIGAPGVNIKSTIIGNEIKPENIASGTGIPFNPDPNVISSRNGDGTYPLCSVSPNICFDKTFFSNATGSDCVGTLCQWGWLRFKESPGLIIVGDNNATSNTTYGNSIDGTITSRILTASASDKIIFSYSARWDLECDNDYVDIEVFDGTNWVLLSGDKNLLNVNETINGSCLTTGSLTNSSHTLTGRMAQLIKKSIPNNAIPFVPFSYNISAYNNPKLQVRFHFVTNTSINSTNVLLGIQINNIRFITQVADYSKAYGYKNGTSMAAPHVAGIAALIKGANPTFTGAQIKTALINGGNVNTSLNDKTSSGKHANAYNAITGINTTAKSTVAGGSSGGGCSIKKTAKFDPIFPGLLLVSLLYWFRNYRKQYKH